MAANYNWLLIVALCLLVAFLNPMDPTLRSKRQRAAPEARAGGAVFGGVKVLALAVLALIASWVAFAALFYAVPSLRLSRGALTLVTGTAAAAVLISCLRERRRKRF